MNRATSGFIFAIVGLSTLLMLGLPIVLFYLLYGVGGAIAGGVCGAVFWLLMGVQFIRVRRHRG